MYHSLATGWADLVLPATSYLERDGTVVNLEVDRSNQRRAVVPPVPDELAWISKLAGRFGVELSPHASVVFDQLADASSPAWTLRRSTSAHRSRIRHAPPAPGAEPRAPVERTVGEHFIGELRLLRYRPLFSGPYVERVPELEFQRAEARKCSPPTRSGGRSQQATSSTFAPTAPRSRCARIDRRLVSGVARVAEEHAGDLHQLVEVVRT